MKEMNEKLAPLNLGTIQSNSPYIIKDFIISDNEKDPIDKIISFNEPFMFDGMFFCVCKQGSALIRVNFREYTVAENSILTIQPKQIFECIHHSDDFLVEMLAFSLDFITDLPLLSKGIDFSQKIASQPILTVSEKEVANLMRYYSFITDTFSNHKLLYLKETIQGLLFALVMELVSMYGENEEKSKEIKKSRGEQVTEQFMILLLKNRSMDRFVSYYADEMFMTAKYLSAVIKKVTGRTINSWIEEVVILNAKILLKSTNHTVLEISEDLHFPNPSYFGRFFKKVTGFTPLEYRGL